MAYLDGSQKKKHFGMHFRARISLYLRWITSGIACWMKSAEMKQKLWKGS